tara:strand:+ start:2905 stop:3189 length:285 start_codon:yes stop_codon:yes gene_type:complete
MWLWLISSIAGSLLGAATTRWFKDTRAGVWCYNKYDAIADWAVERYGVDILDKEAIAWRTKYPNVAKRTDDLEERINFLELEIKTLQEEKVNGK